MISSFRVIIKVNSGTGSTNLDMLAYIRALGVYCYLGVPNTTQVTQETDQNYGTFRSTFRQNLETLTQEIFDLDKTLMLTDLRLLSFGGKYDGITDVACIDAFTEGCSIDANFNFWKKCGAVPLTRLCWLSDMVLRTVVIVPHETVDVDTDSEGKMLAYLELQNKVYCNMLTLKGFDGKEFRLKAPRITKLKTTTVTVPHTKARIEAISTDKSARKFFHAMGGSYLNSDDYFKS